MVDILKKKRVESFEIVLEHDIDEQYQYVPGEMMKGVLVVTCNEEIVVRELLVTLQGEGNVIWEQGAKRGSKASKFRSKEIYLDNTDNLAQSSTSSSGLELSAGVNEYPFYYQLAENLPSSFIGKYGSVTYLIKAQLRPDRKYGADAMITNEPFLVLRRYDLSLEPLKLRVYEESKSQSIGNPCLCGGQVTAFLKLNRTGFVPGEDLRLNADVANGSSYDVTSLQAALIMTSTFHATKSQVTADQTIGKHVDSYVIERGEGRRWNDVRLTIPPYIPESSLEGCDIIDLRYTLVFQVELDYNPKHKDNLRLVIPITIGTHGIRLDDDPAEDPTHRPLYQRVNPSAELPITLNIDDDDGDEMGEIDHSLFENAPSSQPSKSDYKTVEDTSKPDKKHAAPVVNILYGDLVSSDELPDNRPEGTITTNPMAPTKNKRQAPGIPDNLTLTRQDSIQAEEDNSQQAEEDNSKDEITQTRL
ncbi:arrestin domain-containing protein 4-like isoform X2 [Watersipora subatra]|uniref:arrestin domain-containing protein 4-like isoform X2 n=1 Tax=Watersipora subatra TaxID=2589382 RepID=UPI00355C26DE